MNDEIINLGKRMKKRREELGLSQQEVARQLGYHSISSINKIETAVNELPLSKLFKLAEVLNTTPIHLLGLNREYDFSKSNLTGYVKIGVLNDFPKDCSWETIQAHFVIGYEDVPAAWLTRCNDMIAIRLEEAVYPKYCRGDIVIVGHKETYLNGEDVIVCIDDEAPVIRNLSDYSDKYLKLSTVDAINSDVLCIAKDACVILGAIVQLRRWT